MSDMPWSVSSYLVLLTLMLLYPNTSTTHAFTSNDSTILSPPFGSSNSRSTLFSTKRPNNTYRSITTGWHSPMIAPMTTTKANSMTTRQQAQREASSSSSSTPIDGMNPTGTLSRRKLAELTIASIGLGSTILATQELQPTDYGLWGVLPVGPYKRKKTVFESIVPEQIWTLDQKFGILNVQVPVRMTVVRLSSGGLLIYDAVAPTPECVSFLKDLVSKYGPVRHIVLGSVAIEHKVYAGVLAQKFPSAKVWLQPGQYSFPANLPNTLLGFPMGRTFVIPNPPPSSSLNSLNLASSSSSSASNLQGYPDWCEDFDYQMLGPIISRDGAFGETVLYHRATKTLLCTDTVVEVTDEVPKIFDDDPKPLLYHARDTITDQVVDNEDTRKKGWRRVVLFGLFFNPGEIVIKDLDQAIKERRPDINPDFAGVYPWDWVGDDLASFKALQGGLLVAPILQKLILNRYPVETLDFADKVAKWDIQRIIPAHLKNNLKYTGKDYREAFSFLEVSGVRKGLPKPLPADLKALGDAEVNLLQSGSIVKSPPLLGGEYSRDAIMKQTIYQCRADVCSPRASDI